MISGSDFKIYGNILWANNPKLHHNIHTMYGSATSVMYNLKDCGNRQLCTLHAHYTFQY